MQDGVESGILTPEVQPNVLGGRAVAKPTVCLIIPPSPFLLDERVFPFLGLLKVAAVLEQAGYPVEVVDLSAIKNYLEVVEDHVRMSAARHYGITATTPQFPNAVEIARTIRTHRPDARLILGGTHATLVVAACRYDNERGRVGRAQRDYAPLAENFDVIVAGDGETLIFPALEDDAPQLIDGDNRHSPYFLTDERLDATPLPARHLIDLTTYKYAVDGVPAHSLITQLGCPYKCGFCAGRNSPMLRNIRLRSEEGVVEEMVHLYSIYGTRGFMFYDDELNVNPRMIELMQHIARTQRELGTTWKLRGFVKSERFTDEQAAALYEAGFRQLLIGFESGSPRILENIQKVATQAHNSRCMDIARRHDLKVKALMSVGHPGESSTTVDETRRWLLDARPFDFDVTIITPYPGSPYYDQATPIPSTGDNRAVWMYEARSGDRLYQEEVDYVCEADYYKGDPNDGYVSHVWTDHLDRDELVARRNMLEDDVREKLGIPFNPSRESLLYEHSMGQSPPRHIVRSTSS